MSKQIVYLQLSQGKPSYNHFQGKQNDVSFLTIETYKYGTGEKFKTLTSAMNQAQKDFAKETKFYLTQNLKTIGTRSALRIIDAEELVFNQVEFNN